MENLLNEQPVPLTQRDMLDLAALRARACVGEDANVNVPFQLQDGACERNTGSRQRVCAGAR